MTLNQSRRLKSGSACLWTSLQSKTVASMPKKKSKNLKTSLERAGASFKVVSVARSAGIVVGVLLGSVEVDSPEEIKNEIIVNPGLLGVDHISPADNNIKWDSAVDSAAGRPHLSVAMMTTLSAIPQATFQITRRTPCFLARGGQGYI